MPFAYPGTVFSPYTPLSSYNNGQWAASYGGYSLGVYIIPTVASGKQGIVLVASVVSGSTGPTEPDWSGAVPGSTFTDGSVTWTCVGSYQEQGIPPILTLPNDGDPPVAASVVTPLKTLADFMAIGTQYFKTANLTATNATISNATITGGTVDVASIVTGSVTLTAAPTATNEAVRTIDVGSSGTSYSTSGASWVGTSGFSGTPTITNNHARATSFAALNTAGSFPMIVQAAKYTIAFTTDVSPPASLAPIGFTTVPLLTAFPNGFFSCSVAIEGLTGAAAGTLFFPVATGPDSGGPLSEFGFSFTSLTLMPASTPGTIVFTLIAIGY